MAFESKKKVVTAMAGLVLAVLFWAINTVLARGVVDQVPPMALAFYRWVFALVFLLPFAVKPMARERQALANHLWSLFFLSIPSVAIYNSVLYLGALFTSATNISLVVAAMPAMALGLAWMISHDRPSPVQAGGIGLAMIGVLAIIAKGSWQTLAGLAFNPGDLLILISVFSWALYSVMLKKTLLPLSPIPFLMATMIFGTLILLPFYVLELVFYKGFSVNSQVILIFVYLGLCPSILSYALWNHGVRVLGAATASVFIYLVPVFTAMLAYLFLGERFSGYHLWGGLMILGGLILSTVKRART